MSSSPHLKAFGLQRWCLCSKSIPYSIRTDWYCICLVALQAEYVGGIKTMTYAMTGISSLAAVDKQEGLDKVFCFVMESFCNIWFNFSHKMVYISSGKKNQKSTDLIRRYQICILFTVKVAKLFKKMVGQYRSLKEHSGILLTEYFFCEYFSRIWKPYPKFKQPWFQFTDTCRSYF